MDQLTGKWTSDLSWEEPMSKLSLSLALLTLFTSPERAASIQGDLTEGAQTRGRIWFWSQVFRATGVRCLKGFPRSPFEIIGLTVCGMAAWTVTGIVLVTLADSIEIMLQSRGVLVAIRAAPVMLFGTFVTAIILVRVAPVRGIYAIVCSVGASVPFPIFVLLNGGSIPQGETADFVIQMGIGFAAGLLLLATAPLRRRVNRPGRTESTSS